MLTHLIDLLPDMPHLTLLSEVAFGMLGGSFVLYLLSKMPEMLLISAISFLYGVVPLIK